MQSARVGKDHPVAQLVEAEWGVREINELIDRQRKLIEELEESQVRSHVCKDRSRQFHCNPHFALARATSASCDVRMPK